MDPGLPSPFVGLRADKLGLVEAIQKDDRVLDWTVLVIWGVVAKVRA